MKIYPAIDQYGGKVVRLHRGERERATVYGDDPAAVVRAFADAGAERIHVVDLDGAFAGTPVQRDLVAALVRLAHELGAAVQCGGGVRTRAAAETVLGLDADWVVLGTLAIREPHTAAALCRAHPGRLIVAIDARDGMVAVDGWREASRIPAADLADQAEQWGAAALLFTDVARDGLGVGPAVAATAAIQRRVSIPVLASGGVGALDHLAVLKAADISGVVVGRALYEGAFTVEDALSGC